MSERCRLYLISPPRLSAANFLIPLKEALKGGDVASFQLRLKQVSDDEIRAAVKFLLLRLKVLVEPSGAVPAAAVLFHKLPQGIRSVGVVISGGNVDFENLAAC